MSILLDAFRELDRLVVAVCAIGIDHQLHIRPHRLARDAHPRHVLGDRHRADLHLHRLGAHAHIVFHLACEFAQSLALLVVAAGDIGRHAIAEAAEHLVERQVGELGADVPQPDIDRRDRTRGQAAAADQLRLPHLLPQTLDIDRILADQHRCQSRDGGALDLAAAAQADAGDAFGGRDLHHGERHMRVGVLAVGDRLVPRPAEFLGGDAGDLHAAASFRLAAFNVVSPAGASAPTPDNDPTGAASTPRRSRDRSARAAMSGCSQSRAASPSTMWSMKASPPQHGLARPSVARVSGAAWRSADQNWSRPSMWRLKSPRMANAHAFGCARADPVDAAAASARATRRTRGARAGAEAIVEAAGLQMHRKHAQRWLQLQRDVDAAAQLATGIELQAGEVGIGV